MANKLVDSQGLSTILTSVKGYIDNNISSNIVEIIWEDLVELRDNSELVPGCWYRITDYECTTTQDDTQSAGHQFDILVFATANDTLSEECRAIKHEDDEYFTNCNLNAWKIWYCLDNDVTRFLWADANDGKGVIYRMIDEFNNDCPYDFKNIQFYNDDYDEWLYTFCGIPEDISEIFDVTSANLGFDDDKWVEYTPITSFKCQNNTINPYSEIIILDDVANHIYVLNNIIIIIDLVWFDELERYELSYPCYDVNIKSQLSNLLIKPNNTVQEINGIVYLNI